MEFLKKNLQHIIFLFVAVFMLTIFFILFKGSLCCKSWKEENFDLYLNGIVYHDIDADSFALPPLKKGDRVVISRSMEDFDYTNRFLIIKSYNSVLDIFMDGENIYSYGNDLYKKGKFVGTGYHIVELKKPENTAPTLVIDIKASEDTGTDWLEFLKFTSSNSIWSDIINLQMITAVVSVLLFMVGLTGFLYCEIIFFVAKIKNEQLLYTFATAFFIGLWNACISGLFQRMTGNIELSSFLEYASLYMVPYFYIGIIETTKRDSFFIKFISAAKKLYTLLVVIIFVFHFIDIMHVSQFIFFFRIFVIATLAIIFIMLLSDYGRQKNYEKVLTFGYIVSVMLVVVQNILLNINSPAISALYRTYSLGDLFISIAIISVIAAPISSYSLNSREIEIYQTQIQLLKNIAYEDPLTKLYNRHRGMAHIMELRQNGTPYFVIMMDLNNLKTVNDTRGHSRGDKLLTDFSDCINKAFSGKDCMNIRQGGDEFVVIVKTSKQEVIERYLERLNECIAEKNSEIQDDCYISVAFGMADSREVKDADYESIFKIADQRMYEDKIKMKLNSNQI